MIGIVIGIIQIEVNLNKLLFYDIYYNYDRDENVGQNNDYVENDDRIDGVVDDYSYDDVDDGVDEDDGDTKSLC